MRSPNVDVGTSHSTPCEGKAVTQTMMQHAFSRMYVTASRLFVPDPRYGVHTGPEQAGVID